MAKNQRDQMIEKKPKSGHMFLTIGVRFFHQNYLCSALPFPWYGAPSSEYLPPSCPRQSLRR